MGLFDILNELGKIEEENKNREKENLEKEMDAYGLNEHEKELVRNNLQDPWDFDIEEPFEDDDYYKDDLDYDD